MKIKMNALGRMIGAPVIGVIILAGTMRVRAADTVSTPTRVIGGWNICSAALSPNGKNLAVGCSQGNIKLWDLVTTKEKTIYDGFGSNVGSVVFSPDGSNILDCDGRLWDVATRKVVRSYKNISGPVIFSHNGTKIATKAPANDGTCRTIIILNAMSGDTIRSFTVDCKYVNLTVAGVAFSPDDSKILCATNHTYNDGYFAWFVDIWDIATGKKITAAAYGFSSYKYYSGVTSVAFSPDNKHYAYALYADTNSTVTIRDLSNDSSSINLHWPTRVVTLMAFSPDGSKLLTGSTNGTVCLWNALTGDSIRIFKAQGGIVAASFFPDGTKIITSSSYKTSHIWDVATGDTLGTFLEPSWLLASNMTSLAHSPDGSKILEGEIHGAVSEWDFATGNAVMNGFIGSGSLSYAVQSMAYSSDGSKVVVGGQEGAAKLWNVSTNTSMEIHLPNESTITSVAFLPDGSAFLTGSCDSAIRLWNATTGELIRTFRCNDLYVNSLAISPDGGKMWVGSGYSVDQHARLWNIATGDSLRTVESKYQVNKLVFSPDCSKLLVGADYCAYLWDAQTGNRLRTIDSGAEYISSVDYSHDGAKILIGKQNGRGSLWDAASGRCLRIFTDFSMEDAMFSQNDSMVISRSTAYIFLWDISKVNASILLEHTPIASKTIALLSARQNTLSFSFPSATQLTRQSCLHLYQLSGRRVMSLTLRHADNSGRLTLLLPQNIGAGMYMFRFSGVGVSEPSGVFAIVK